MKAIVIIPAYNEAESITNVVADIKKNAPFVDYVIINDCSTDETKKICADNDLNYINLPINLGIGGAVQCGYLYAFEKSYDIAIQHDGDGQHDPRYIKDVIIPIENGYADIVIGSRFLTKEGFQSSVSRRLGIKILHALIKITTGKSVLDVTSGYRAINRKYMALYAQDYAQDYPEPEAIVLAAMYNAHIKEVPMMMKERIGGSSSIHSWKSFYYMLKVTMAIILYRFTFKRKG